MNSTATHCTTKSWFVFGRVFFGMMWLWEVFWGHSWKWGNPAWMGEGAGSWLREDAMAALAVMPWRWAGWFLEVVVVPYAEFWSYAVVWLQLTVAVGLIAGLLVKPISLIALVHMLPMFLAGHWRFPPFYAVGFLVALATPVGLGGGVDSWLGDRLSGARSSLVRMMGWLMAPSLPRKWGRNAGIACSAFLALFFLLQTAAVDSSRYRMVSLELAVLFGLIAAGFVLAATMERAALMSRLVGMFVGYRFLHEIWVVPRVELTGLPGWSTGDELGAVLSTMAANHYAFMGQIVNTVFLQVASFWALVFAVVQTAVGVVLVFNWKPRMAALSGIGYLALLQLLGFSRYVPFMLGLLILAFTLRGAPRLPRPTVPVALSAFALLSLAAAIGGIVPGVDREHLGSDAAAMGALYSAAFLFAALTQTRDENHGS